MYVCLACGEVFESVDAGIDTHTEWEAPCTTFIIGRLAKTVSLFDLPHLRFENEPIVWLAN